MSRILLVLASLCCLLLSAGCSTDPYPACLPLPAAPHNVTDVKLLPLTSSQFAHFEEVHGVVRRVYDGDTLQLAASDGRTLRVRLAGIDAPEHDQPYGPAARQYLERAVLGRSVVVQVFTTDLYGRSVGRVHVDSEAAPDVGAQLLLNGLAWHYAYYDHGDPQYNRYQWNQREATRLARGLWSQRQPVPPWRWRHEHPAA